MKKVILPLCAAAILAGATACGDKGAASKSPDGITYTQDDKLLADSLGQAYGALMAANAQQQIEQMKTMRLTPEQAKAFNMDTYLKGVKEVAKIDTADMAYIMGLQMGMQIWFAANGMPPQLKVPVTADIILKGFQATIKRDSIDNFPEIQGNWQNYFSKAQQNAQQKELDMIEATEEAINNKAAGIAYADSLVANEGYTRAESGLVYKIEVPGDDVKVARNNRIKLRYTGKHLDGTTFDQTREAPVETYVSAFIPGFTEGLTLLGKGGKATIVIPAEIGYGVEGKQPTIGYNETLVFDIEIEDIL